VKNEIENWFLKADNDLKTARDELAAEDPATDTVCFHAQQCAEKYVKAYLVYHNKEFRKTHNLAELIESCVEIDAGFVELLKLNVHELTIYATELRYPEYFYMPTTGEAEKAIAVDERVKEFVTEKLEAKG